MPAWTLQQAKAKAIEWMNAESTISAGQAYTIGSRSYQYANLGEVREHLQFWRDEVTRLERGGIRIRQGVPV